MTDATLFDAQVGLTDGDDVLPFQLGIREAFDEFEADFSKIAGADEPLYLSKILQKGFLDVSEAGSEAGAATLG